MIHAEEGEKRLAELVYFLETELHAQPLTEQDVSTLLPKPNRFAHKGTNGRGMLIAGSHDMMGAAVLAATAAVRSGIGLLTCHVPKGEGQILQATVPEAMIDSDESDKWFSIPPDVEKINAVGIGPGLGRHPETTDAIVQLFDTWKGPTVVDADALNLMSASAFIYAYLPKNAILTPHPMEFDRLVGKSKNDFERLNKLGTFASRFGVYVVLKGPRTVVMKPDGRCWYNTSGNPGMAKGGMGDVLTGVILALLANGLPPEKAACGAVFAHGLAADLLAEEVGMRGISAGQVAEGMGRAWRKLEGLGIYDLR